MASGIMPAVGVPAGDSRVVGGVSVAPAQTPEAGCDVAYHKAGCAPPNDRAAWNWLIANVIAGQNECGLNYDCNSPDQLRNLIVCLARKSVLLCRSTVTPAPTVWPPTSYSGPFVADDTADPPVLYWWDCNSSSYVALPAEFPSVPDFCTDGTRVPTVNPRLIQCVGGTPTVIPMQMTCVSGTTTAVAAAICTQTIIPETIVGGLGNGTWSAEFATNYVVNGAGLVPFVFMRVNGATWFPIIELIEAQEPYTGRQIAIVGPRHALPVTGLVYGSSGGCARRWVLNGLMPNITAISACSTAAQRTFMPTDLVEFALTNTGQPGTQIRWQVTYFPC